jgi:hypothetical protein
MNDIQKYLKDVFGLDVLGHLELSADGFEYRSTAVEDVPLESLGRLLALIVLEPLVLF